MTRRFDHKCALGSLQTGGPKATIENGKGSTVTSGLLLRRAPAVSAAWGLSFVCRNPYLIPYSGFLLFDSVLNCPPVADHFTGLVCRTGYRSRYVAIKKVGYSNKPSLSIGCLRILKGTSEIM